jgi:hypothetical protein
MLTISMKWSCVPGFVALLRVGSADTPTAGPCRIKGAALAFGVSALVDPRVPFQDTAEVFLGFGGIAAGILHCPFATSFLTASRFGGIQRVLRDWKQSFPRLARVGCGPRGRPQKPRLAPQTGAGANLRLARQSSGRNIDSCPSDPPQNAALYTERGLRELPLREFARVRADLSGAAALNPKDMVAYYHLGLAHYFLGEFTQAVDAFHHAVETAPNTDERINRFRRPCSRRR